VGGNLSATGAASMGDWNPALYGRYAADRERPALDLLARVPIDRPARVVDLGCGAGASTALLAARWPESHLCGIDSSPAMLAEARKALPRVEFAEGDIQDWSPRKPFDLVFSNATLQWIEDHTRLRPRLFDAVAGGGALAVQMPRNFDAPSHRLMAETAAQAPWREKLAGVVAGRADPVAAPEQYARLLAPLAARLDIWETVYLMRLAGENPVVEWTRATGLRPYLDALDEPERGAFLADYARRIAAAYPPEADGLTLFPFRRIFMVATRPA
jgi:trans-aconitate 2-methyltransferase